jgi:hypothetical protein
MLKSVSVLTAATVLGLAVVCGSATPGDAKSSTSRFRCDALGTGDVALSVKYEQRVLPKARTTFMAEFEGTALGGSVAGQSVVFSVDTVAVGTVTLGSELDAELKLDSKAKGRGAKKPFPATFPVVQAGSVVEAAVNGTVVLGCALTLN